MWSGISRLASSQFDLFFPLPLLLPDRTSATIKPAESERWRGALANGAKNALARYVPARAPCRSLPSSEYLPYPQPELGGELPSHPRERLKYMDT